MATSKDPGHRSRHMVDVRFWLALFALGSAGPAEPEVRTAGRVVRGDAFAWSRRECYLWPLTRQADKSDTSTPLAEQSFNAKSD